MFAGFTRHLASGLRRQVPEPVHGASTSTRSKRGPSAGSAASSPAVHHLHVAHAGALQALEDRRAAASCRSRRRRSGRCSASPRRAPASCRRRRHTNRAPACAGRRRRAARRSASPRPAPRTSPCRAPSRLRVRRLAGPFGRRHAHAQRRQGVGVGAVASSALSTLSRVAFSVLTRRSTGARRPARRPPRPRARRRHARTTAAAIPGMSPAMMRRRGGGSARGEAGLLGVAQGPRSAREPSAAALTSRASWPSARGAAPSASARGVSLAHAAAMDGAGGARRTPACRWRRGRPSRQSDAPCPNRPAPWRPGGVG